MKQATNGNAPAKRKVLFLVTKATWGGAQKYVFDLATRLPRNEFDVVVAYGEKGKLASDLFVAGIETCEISSLARDVAVFSDLKSFFEILSCIGTTRPDVIHLNSSKAAALGALAARFQGVRKIVFTVHGWPFKEDRNVLARALIRGISWLTAVLSHTVIVVSKKDEQIGRSMLFLSNKIRHIPIGIHTPDFLTREEAAARLSIRTASPRIVTIAELTANKGLRYAIEAVSLLKSRGTNVTYFIISDGEEREALEALALEKGVSDRVRFLGFVDNAARYLKAFDVFLLPSIKEGMPYVLVEAESAGLPIIATTAVDATYSLQVPAGDVNALADALVETQNLQIGTTFGGSLVDMIERTSDAYLSAQTG